MTIICDCKHEVYHHFQQGCGLCTCYLSFQAVEARYWARRMMQWAELEMKHNTKIERDYITLQSKLDNIINDQSITIAFMMKDLRKENDELRAKSNEIQVELDMNFIAKTKAEHDALQVQLHKAEERYIFLQKTIITQSKQLDIAREAMKKCPLEINKLKSSELSNEQAYIIGGMLNILHDALEKINK